MSEALSGTRTATEALQAFNHAFERGDVDGLVATFAQDAVFEANGAVACEGPEAIGNFQQFVFKVTEPRRIEVHRVAESAGSAIAEATFYANMRETGAYIRLPLALNITVHDGKITRFAEHFDSYPKRYFDGEPELGARDLLTTFWQAFADHDTATATQLLSHDSVYNGPLTEHGAAGTEDIREWLANAPTNRNITAVQITHLTGDHDTAFAEGRQLQTNTEDPNSGLPFICILEAHAGKITRLTEYLDTTRLRTPQPRDLGNPTTQ